MTKTGKGFAMVVYDYKFPALATKLYYHYKINQKAGTAVSVSAMLVDTRQKKYRSSFYS